MPVFDKDKFAEWLNANALPPFGSEECAMYVRLALQEAGCDTNPHPAAAKDWGQVLIRIGFTILPGDVLNPQKGDIIVFAGSPATRNLGHIEGYDGNRWISDFVQPDMWPSRRAHAEATAHSFYRWSGGAPVEQPKVASQVTPTKPADSP